MFPIHLIPGRILDGVTQEPFMNNINITTDLH